MAKKSSKRRRIVPVLRKAGDPILSTVCQAVDEKDITQSFLSRIFRDILYILTNSTIGVGLAANQAGYDQRVIAIKDTKEPSGWLFMVNPKITEHGEDKETKIETCLSYAKESAKIARWKSVTVAYFTINPEGETEFWEDDFHGLQARIIQHEIDHLNGMCKVASGDF